MKSSFIPIAFIMVGFLLIVTVPFSSVFTQYGTYNINTGDSVCLDGYDQGDHILRTNFCGSVTGSQYTVIQLSGGHEFDTGNSQTKILSINGVSVSEPASLPITEPTQIVSASNQTITTETTAVPSNPIEALFTPIATVLSPTSTISSPIAAKPPIPISPMIGIILIFVGGALFYIQRK